MTIDDRKYEIALANSGMNAGECAKRAGLSRQRLLMILNQKRVTPVAVGKIAKALGVDAREIIVTED